MGQIRFDFSGKAALVTGARVALAVDKRAGGEALVLPSGVSRDEQVRTLIERGINEYGHLDVACNNAGIEGRQGTTVECAEENFDKVIATNVKGVWLCMKHEIPVMLERGGSIVNLSSIAGLIGFPGLPAYVASKDAVAGLTKTLWNSPRRGCG